VCLFFFSVSVAVLFAESYILFQLYFLFCEIKDCTNLEFIEIELSLDSVVGLLPFCYHSFSMVGFSRHTCNCLYTLFFMVLLLFLGGLWYFYFVLSRIEYILSCCFFLGFVSVLPWQSTAHTEMRLAQLLI